MFIDELILTRLKDNDPNLRDLNLSGGRLQHSDVQLLMKALVKNTNLVTLNISYNQIGNKGAKALAQCTSLKTLDVECNEIGDEGAISLAQNTTLTNLLVWFNHIGDKGAQALDKNITLTTLNVLGNPIGSEWYEKLKQMIQTNQQALIQRREQWLYTLLLLATAQPEFAKKSKKNTFAWARLPKDLKIAILNLVELKSDLSIGKTPQQLQEVNKFIFDNQELVKGYWEAKHSIKLIETKTSVGLHFAFRKITTIADLSVPQVRDPLKKFKTHCQIF